MKTKIWIVILCLVATTLGGLNLWSAKNQTSQTANVVSIAGWKTYTDTQYGIEFSYPTYLESPQSVVVANLKISPDNVEDFYGIKLGGVTLIPNQGQRTFHDFYDYVSKTLSEAKKAVEMNIICSKGDPSTPTPPAECAQYSGEPCIRLDTNSQIETVMCDGDMASPSYFSMVTGPNNKYVFAMQPRGQKNDGLFTTPPAGFKTFEDYTKVLQSIKFIDAVGRPSDTAKVQNWATYTNSEYGFEFKYPSGTEVSNPSAFNRSDPNGPQPKGTLLGFVYQDSYYEINIQPGRNVESEITRNNAVSMSYVLSDYKKITIAGMDAYSDRDNAEIHFSDANNLYIISADDSSYNRLSSNNEIYKMILSSFKFTKPSNVVEVQNWMTYTNSEYGFSMVLPASWKGVNIKQQYGSVYFYFPNSQAFSIGKFAINDWGTITGPVEIARNDKYVYYHASLTGYSDEVQDLDKALATFKLTK